MISLPDLPCFYDAKCINLQEQYSLPNDELHHATKVLRVSNGNSFLVTNGQGIIWLCVVIDAKRNELVYKTIEKISEFQISPFKTNIGCGILGSASRMGWLVEKAVEIGVNSIYFFETSRTKKAKANLSRLEKTAIAAVKQSRKAFLPKIETIDLNELVIKPFNRKHIAICDGNDYPHLTQYNDTLGSLIIIGPEGDFSENEIELCLSNEFKPCSLGNERLRSETAAIYSLICQNL
jgi:16S rRNA (uracil1498-N3)-methyltransferase